MIDDLSELVFEGLDEAVALQLAQEILGRPLSLPDPSEGVVDVAIPRLKISAATTLTNVHLRVLRYDDNVFDVEINFIPSEAEHATWGALMDALLDFATVLSTAHGVSSYYAGMDPAVDQDTRYFTGTTRGPLW